MTTAIELARPQRLEFTEHQSQIIRDAFANGASDEEFAVLMEIAKARSLNPMLRQIWFVKRWDSVKRREVWAPQISIDGLRSVAERSGRYGGQDEAEYEYGADGKISCAKVKVYKAGIARPFVGVAFWSEYVQTTKDGKVTSMWANKPHIMLGKCAESLALRKAFPEDTSGLYIPEEQAVIDAREVQSLPTPEQAKQVDNSQALIAEWKEKIARVGSDEELASLSGDIGKLPATVKTALRSVYAARKKELTQPAEFDQREPGED